MSRAFLRESDLEEKPAQVKRASLLPSGAKNLITAAGRDRLRRELERLVGKDRPALVAAKEEGRAELEPLDERIRHLEESLRTAEVVEPPAGEERTRVRFGAEVGVRDKAGTVTRYRLVGVDEADPDHGWISYLSPLARALTNARVGQKVAFRGPRGVNELEIMGIDYPSE